MIYNETKLSSVIGDAKNGASMESLGFGAAEQRKTLLSNKDQRQAQIVIKAACSIEQYASKLDGTKIAFINPELLSLIDTYVRVYPVDRDEFLKQSEDAGHCLEISAQPIAEAKYDSQRRLETVEYIIIHRDDNPFANAEPIYECSPFIILRNLDPANIYTITRTD